MRQYDVVGGILTQSDSGGAENTITCPLRQFVFYEVLWES
jgi:hypothetical protein